MSSRFVRALKLVGVNFVVLAVCLILGVGVLEGYLRLTIPASSGASIFQPTLSTRRYKVMKADARIVAWGSEFRTNRQGFRDNRSDIPQKTAAEYRIIVLGDSFTASAGVDFDRIYTTRLQEDLRRRAPGASVINLAVGGYNIIQYELVLEEVGFALSPDLVLVAVFPFNDLSNADYRGNFRAAAGMAPPVPRAAGWYEGLYTYRAFWPGIAWRLEYLFTRPTALPPAVSGGAVGPENTARQDNLAAFRRIFASTRQRGGDALAIFLPNTDDFASQRAQLEPFEEACNEHGIRCVSLLDQFIESGVNPRALRLNLLDGHPNDRYNALAARFIAGHVAPLVERSAGRLQSGPAARPGQ
jgi:hypothetical protein